LEIYNETIRDLLENDETQKHEIKHLSHGRTIVTDAKIGIYFINYIENI